MSQCLTSKLLSEQHDSKDLSNPSHSTTIYLTVLHSVLLKELFKHDTVLTHLTRSYPHIVLKKLSFRQCFKTLYW